MRNTVLFLLLILPACLPAQQSDADILLGKAIAAMKADAAVQMDYIYNVYDEENDIVQSDKGVMRLDGDKYALLMNNMMVWCNGFVQWCYMKEIDEIYITEASSDEAQSLSPLCIMEHYRENSTKSLEKQGGVDVVSLKPVQDGSVSRVELFFDSKNLRLKAMYVYMNGQGRVEALLEKYTPSCKFPAASYECPVKELPGAEIIDMR